mmetsp:Transcript_25579/g.45532  ORF Transcript_25579/g.45532 Transcript_25579/m.45532 type:complete len:136 (-) Transcript_25579:68-475(-)
MPKSNLNSFALPIALVKLPMISFALSLAPGPGPLAAAATTLLLRGKCEVLARGARKREPQPTDGTKVMDEVWKSDRREMEGETLPGWALASERIATTRPILYSRKASAENEAVTTRVCNQRRNSGLRDLQTLPYR